MGVANQILEAILSLCSQPAANIWGTGRLRTEWETSLRVDVGGLPHWCSQRSTRWTPVSTEDGPRLGQVHNEQVWRHTFGRLHNCDLNLAMSDSESYGISKLPPCLPQVM